jgi:hypothetical protein
MEKGPIEEDVFHLPETMDPNLKRLFNHLLEVVMSEALRDPDAPRDEILAVVERLAGNLRQHWAAGE